MHMWTVITPADQRTVAVTADYMSVTDDGQLRFFKKDSVGNHTLHAAFAHRGWVSFSRTPEAPAA